MATQLRFRQLPEGADDFNRRVHAANMTHLPCLGCTPLIEGLHHELIELDSWCADLRDVAEVVRDGLEPFVSPVAQPERLAPRSPSAPMSAK